MLDTLRALADRYDVVAALFLGGEEKLRDRQAVELDELYGLPVTHGGRGGRRAALREALGGLLSRTGARVVVDVSDEPVLGYYERFQLISVALSWGARYVGADFVFSPQPLARLSSKPSLAIIGTGKRVGKTAVSGLFGRRLGGRFGLDQVVIVAMGRGGPAAPQVVYGGDRLGAAGSARGLKARVPCRVRLPRRRGAHRGDHSRLPALRRRHGRSLDEDTVDQALRLVDDMPATVVVWEGSGSANPPVQAQAVVCVASALQPPEYITGYLGTYRMLISDALFLTMCEPPFCDVARVDALRSEIASANPEVDLIPTVLRPRPVDSVAGRRVAFFTTATPESAGLLARHLEEAHGARVTAISTDLARRPALLEAVAAVAGKADVFLTEIKAAAVDVVAEAAAAQGKELVFCDNEPVATDGRDLTAVVDGLTDKALARFAAGEYGPRRAGDPNGERAMPTARGDEGEGRQR